MFWALLLNNSLQVSVVRKLYKTGKCRDGLIKRLILSSMSQSEKDSLPRRALPSAHLYRQKPPGAVQRCCIPLSRPSRIPSRRPDLADSAVCLLAGPVSPSVYVCEPLYLSHLYSVDDYPGIRPILLECEGAHEAHSQSESVPSSIVLSTSDNKQELFASQIPSCRDVETSAMHSVGLLVQYDNHHRVHFVCFSEARALR